VLGSASLLSLFLVFAGALSFRWGVLPFGASFSIFGLALLACALLSMVAGALIFRRLARKQGLEKMSLWLFLCLLPVVVVVNQVGVSGFQAPAIHDISTDLLHPPVFVLAQVERGPGDNTLAHGGEALAEQQRLAYPQLEPLHLSASLADVWAAALAVVGDNNWRVLGADKKQGRIEAVATTRLMGFSDDIVIRIKPEAPSLTMTSGGAPVSAEGGDKNKPLAVAGVIVDVRSVSRVGVSDLGANAARIDSFLTALQRRLNNALFLEAPLNK